MPETDKNRDQEKIDDAILSINDGTAPSPPAPAAGGPAAPPEEDEAAAAPQDSSSSEEVAASPTEPAPGPQGSVSGEEIVEQEDVVEAPAPEQADRPAEEMAQADDVGKTVEEPQPAGPPPAQTAIADVPQYTLPREADAETAVGVKIGGIDLGTTYSAISCYSRAHKWRSTSLIWP